MRGNSTRARVLAGAGLGAGTAFALAPAAAQATDYPVANTDDSGPGSFRTAINSANGNMGPDTITFNSSLSGTIDLSVILPAVTGPVEITGPTSGSVTVDTGALAVGLSFNATASPSKVSNLSFLDGSYGIDGLQGSLELTNVTVTSPVNVGVQTFGDGAGPPEQLTLIDSEVSGGQLGVRTADGANISLQGTAVHDSQAGVRLTNGGVLSVTDSSVTGNTVGGGIDLVGADGLSMVDSVVSGNTSAGAPGGGISQDEGYATIYDSTIAGNSATNGGGIWTSFTYTLLQQSTVSGNTASGNGGGVGGSFIYDLDLYASTFSGNTATSGYGGGIGVASDTTVDVYNSTFSGNSAPPGKGGGIANYFGDVDIDVISTIVGNSAGGDLDGPAGTFAGSFNLIEDILPFGIGPDNIIGVDPHLGPLADNGGPTLTHRPAATSPGLDKGSQVNGFTEDQRDGARTVDLPLVANGSSPAPPGTDVGSVELSLAEGPQPPATQPPATPPKKKCKSKKKKKKKCKKKRKK